MAILWFGGGNSPAAGEPVAPVPPRDERAALAGTSGITGPEFAVGFPTIGSLHRLHLAVVAAVLAHLGFSIFRRDGGAGPRSGGRWRRTARPRARRSWSWPSCLPCVSAIRTGPDTPCMWRLRW